MQATTQDIFESDDQLIEYLDLKWCIELPLSNLSSQPDAADSQSHDDANDLARECLHLIRYLSNHDRIDIWEVIQDFENRAQSICSLPTNRLHSTSELSDVEQTHSFKSCLPNKKSQTKAIPPIQSQLLHVLTSVLQDEYTLLAMSDEYRRTSSAIRRAASDHTTDPDLPPVHFTTRLASRTKINQDVTGPRMSSESMSSSSNKRRTSESEQDLEKDHKRQRPSLSSKLILKQKKITEMFQIRKTDGTFSHEADPLPSTYEFLKENSNSTSKSPTMEIEHPFLLNDRSFESTTESSGISGSTSMDSSTNRGFDSMTTDIIPFEPMDSYQANEDIFDANFDVSILEDEDFKRSLAELDMLSQTSRSEKKQLLQLVNEFIHEGPFNRRKEHMLKASSYWYCFELHRLSIKLQVDVGEVNNKIMALCQAGKRSDDQTLHKAIQKLIASHHQRGLILSSEFRDWFSSKYRYCDPNGDRSIYLSASLKFSDDLNKRIFDFELQPVRSDKGCRFHRQYGADRFMVMTLPYLTKSSLPSAIKDVSADGKLLHESVIGYLSTQNLYIANRYWRLFYVEPTKPSLSKKSQGEKVELRIHLFATHGFGLDFDEPYLSMTINDFTNEFLAIRFNLDLTNTKLFSRMRLGLSKTTPTMCLEPYEFIDVRDKRSIDVSDNSDGVVMNDGCARMSLSLAKAIWSVCGSDCGPLPSAFQGRISGAKGLWIVDYSNSYPQVSERNWWIEISDSQLKIKPHPSRRLNAKPYLRTFEVLKTSSPSPSAHLNIQFITIMANRGVPRSCFEEALRANLSDYLTALKSALNNPEELFLWMQRYHRGSLSSSSAENIGALPKSKENEIMELLYKGLDNKTCGYLRKCIRNLLIWKLNSFTQKLRIEIPCSARMFCVPDPHGILKEDEIQVNFSQGWNDPVKQVVQHDLSDLRVLVSRNPAMIPSDIQSVQGAYYPELKDLKDVAIFSIQGQQSLASMLAGGDYDGDAVTLVWDTVFTEHYVNAPVSSLPSKESFNIQSFAVSTYMIFDHPYNSEHFDEFIRSCCSFNARQGKVGIVTAFHDMITYAGSDNLESTATKDLSTLAGYLVDADKHGDFLDDDAWNHIRSRTLKSLKLKEVKEPAYKTNSPPRLKPQEQYRNIIDHLKFTIADQLRDEALTKFHLDCLDMRDLDVDLMSTFRRECNRSELNPSRHGNMQEIISELDASLKSISVIWSSMIAQYKDKPPTHIIHAAIQSLYHDFLQIKPAAVDHDLRKDFEEVGGDNETRWSLFRASYFYKMNHPASLLVWKLAGDELGSIKARSQGQNMEMVRQIRNLMKADTRKLKRLQGQASIDMDEENGDEYEVIQW